MFSVREHSWRRDPALTLIAAPQLVRGPCSDARPHDHWRCNRSPKAGGHPRTFGESLRHDRPSKTNISATEVTARQVGEGRERRMTAVSWNGLSAQRRK